MVSLVVQTTTILLPFIASSAGFLAVRNGCYRNSCNFSTINSSSSSSSSTSSIVLDEVAFDELITMDVVLFRRVEKNSNSDYENSEDNSGNEERQETIIELGAVQENGLIAPLSTWTLESVYTSSTNDMLEFLVDENLLQPIFPGLSENQVEVVTVLEGSMVGYGSRQVNGGKGPGNPHGEESELLYYVDRSVLDQFSSVACQAPDDINGPVIGRETDYDHADRKWKLKVNVNTDLEHTW